MDEKPGRNQPCWCGSGKKYKHCHLRQDECDGRFEREEIDEPNALVSAPVKVVKELLKEMNPRSTAAALPEKDSPDPEWKRFENADLEVKIALFNTAVDDRKLDADVAFEMLQLIRDESKVRHETGARQRFTRLIEHLRLQMPEVYSRDAAYYLVDLVTDSIADQRWETLPELMDGLAEIAGDNIDEFFRVVDALLYHGQTSTLFDAMNAAWDKVRVSENIVPTGVDEFSTMLMHLVLHRYVEKAKEPRADDPELTDALGVYGEHDNEWFERAVRHLSSPAPSSWRVEDFGESVVAEQWVSNVYALLFEFMADQRRRGHVPFGRSELACEQLINALHQQFSEPETRSGRGAAKSRSCKPGQKPEISRSSPLVPLSGTMDITLASHFQFMVYKPYKAGAVMELLPAYLRFLARLGLIHPAEMDRALEDLRPLGDKMVTILDDHGADIHLVKAVKKAWAESVLDALRQDPALAAARARQGASFHQ